MPDEPSITLVKTFTYRDLPEEWSNTYHFTGTTPGSDAAWRTLAEAIWESERHCYDAGNTLTVAYGYAAGVDHSVATIDFVADPPTHPAGAFSAGTGEKRFSGDQAGWIRAKVGRSSSGKQVYLRKYFHGGYIDAGDSDKLASELITAYQTHAAALVAGTIGTGFTWCGPQGAAATAPLAGEWVTTRTLKRRGRRPS